MKALINTEKTFILGHSDSANRQVVLDANFVEIPNLINEVEIHNWITELFNNNKDINKIVIEIGDNPTRSLQIGYHIRLSIEELREKTLVPILFISAFSLNFVMRKAVIYSQILATECVYFSEFENINSLKEEIGLIKGLTPSEYLTGFLKIIHVQPDETLGRHSLANIWGAFAMDKAANTNALQKDAEFKKKLYFKYVAAVAVNPLSSEIAESDKDANNIDAKDKKILLIDDEADKGWQAVLRKVFQTSTPDDFVVIQEKVKDFDAFSDESKKIIEKNHFDLYLVDLRLNGLEEEGALKANEFSGMKVLEKIKSLNKGNQVIIFTASNKVWNLKALLDKGADGYYMKESPEYNFTKEFSEQNYSQFQKEVKNCFNRGYLRTIYKETQELIKLIDSLTYSSSDFKAILKNQLLLSYYLLEEAKIEEQEETKTKKQFAYAFVTLYLIIEIINNQFISEVKDKVKDKGKDKGRDKGKDKGKGRDKGKDKGKGRDKGKDRWKIKDIGCLLDWDKYKMTEQPKSEVTGNRPPSQWQKMAGLYFQKWKGEDYAFIKKLSDLINQRNWFIHKDKKLLDTDNIYQSEGFCDLFDWIKKIIEFL